MHCHIQRVSVDVCMVGDVSNLLSRGNFKIVFPAGIVSEMCQSYLLNLKANADATLARHQPVSAFSNEKKFTCLCTFPGACACARCTHMSIGHVHNNT